MAERGQWQTTPLMVDGRLYVTTPWSKLYAFDAATGKQLWKYDPQVPRELAAVSLCCNNSNRGGVFWKGKIIWGDARRAPGRRRCRKRHEGLGSPDHQSQGRHVDYGRAAHRQRAWCSSARAAANITSAGYLSAWDAETGKFLWKIYVVPGDPSKGPDGAASDNVMPMAAKDLERRMVEGRWRRPAVGRHRLRPENEPRDLRHTGNGAPWPAEYRSPGGGDNLFISSIVALDAKTGKYRWHYQAVPRENFDFDNTSPLTVARSHDQRRDEARGHAGAEERHVLRDRSGHGQSDQRHTW